MREIKFRGKRIDNGEWVYGGIATTAINHNTVIVCENRNTYYGIVPYIVDPATVGQYTGLKDHNGVEIWEGDISQFEFEGIKYKTCPVKYEVELSCFHTDLRFGNTIPEDLFLQFDQELKDTYEVIGNIHDNPELL